MRELERVQAAYAGMWAKLGYPEPLWPLAVAPLHDGSYHAEFAGGKYRWIASERGAYLDLMETAREEELLEWVALDLTRALAHRDVYEGPGKPRPAEGAERRSHQRQVELVGALDPAWAARKLAQLKKDGLL